MPARRIRKLHGSTDESLRWLNYAYAPEHAAGDLPDPKRRRATNETNVYNLPVSPEPLPNPRRSTRNLRSRRTPAVHEALSYSAREEDGQSIRAGSGSAIGEAESNDTPAPVGIEEDHPKEVAFNDERHFSESDEGSVSFLGPIELFPSQDTNTGSVDDEAIRGAGSDIGSQSPGANETVNSSRRQSEDLPDTATLGEAQANSTPTRIANSAIEVQSAKNSTVNENERSASYHTPEIGHQVSQIASPHPKEEHAHPSHSIFTWLADAIEESGFKESWKVIRTARNVKRRADPSMIEHFRHIRRMKTRLQRVYETMTENTTSDLSAQVHWRKQCSLIANNIFKEIQWFIYDKAASDNEAGAYLVNQLEAHVVPWLIELVYFGFRAFKVRGDWATPHFRFSLDLLWGCSYKISCFPNVPCGIGRGVSASSRMVMAPVKGIKDALNDGRLLETGQVRYMAPQYKHFQLEVESHISCKPWTRVEKDALRKAFASAVLDGLKGKIVSFLLMYLSNENR